MQANLLSQSVLSMPSAPDIPTSQMQQFQRGEKESIPYVN
jgi:hypothetical protein